MEDQPIQSSSHSVYLIRLHIVFVTKYRREVINPEVMTFLGTAFRGVLEKWNCSLVEFGGEADHVHLLVGIHPALNISELINNLKSATSKKTRNQFRDHVAKFYLKPYFWNRAYYIGSVGTVSLETIRNYVEKQGTKEKSKTKDKTAR
jgi:putative transposase